MKIRMFLCALSICFMALVQIGCNTARDIESVGTTRVTAPVDYKNGIFFFDCVGEQFGNSLSVFITKNPKLELVSMVSVGRYKDGWSGAGLGYFVVFRNKGKK